MYFFLRSFCVNESESDEERTTESTQPPPLRTRAWERYRPHNSPRCLRIVAEEMCGMCASMTHCCCCCATAEFRKLSLLCSPPQTLTPSTSGPQRLPVRACEQLLPLARIISFVGVFGGEHSNKRQRQSRCRCSVLPWSIDNTIPKSNTLSSDTRTYVRGRQHSQHFDLRDITAVSWGWGVCGGDTLLPSAVVTRRVT